MFVNTVFTRIKSSLILNMQTALFFGGCLQNVESAVFENIIYLPVYSFLREVLNDLFGLYAEMSMEFNFLLFVLLNFCRTFVQDALFVW